MNGMKEYVHDFFHHTFMINDVGYIEHSIYSNQWYYSVVNKNRKVFGQRLRINIDIDDKENRLRMNMVRPDGSAVVFDTPEMTSNTHDGYCYIKYTDGEMFHAFIDKLDEVLKDIKQK